MELQRRFFEPPRQSFFLFGPRGTGKTTWLRQAFPDALIIDLLLPDAVRELVARPERLRDFVRVHQKAGDRIRSQELRGLETFGTDYPGSELVLLHRGNRRERRGRVWVIPVEQFLSRLEPASLLLPG